MVDWTLDDEEDHPIFSTRPSSTQIAPTPPVKDDIEQPPQLDEADVSKPLPALPTTSNAAIEPVSAASTQGSSKSGNRQPRQSAASGSKRGKGKTSGAKNESRASAPAPARAAPLAPPLIGRGSSQKVVDADGFEQVIKKQAASQTQPQGGRGNGSTRGKSDRGRGGAQGQGNGQGQGQRGRSDRGMSLSSASGRSGVSER